MRKQYGNPDLHAFFYNYFAPLFLNELYVNWLKIMNFARAIEGMRIRSSQLKSGVSVILLILCNCALCDFSWNRRIRMRVKVQKIKLEKQLLVEQNFEKKFWNIKKYWKKRLEEIMLEKYFENKKKNMEKTGKNLHARNAAISTKLGEKLFLFFVVLVVLPKIKLWARWN